MHGDMHIFLYIPKTNNPSLFSLYRSIRILPFLSKLHVRIIFTQLNLFLSKTVFLVHISQALEEAISLLLLSLKFAMTYPLMSTVSSLRLLLTTY